MCVCELVNNRFSTMHASLDAVTLNELSLAHLHTNTFLITSRHTWHVRTYMRYAILELALFVHSRRKLLVLGHPVQ